jgi:hypothetical protein
MSGYLRSANPTGPNRRIHDRLSLLNRFENTDQYRAYREQGLSISAALTKCQADAEKSA